MTTLHRQVARAQRRLWLIRWLRHIGWSIVLAAGVFALIVITVRLLGLSWPLGTIAAGLSGAAVLGSGVACFLTRENAATAAARLDENAGLKERISSGLYVQNGRDPFEQAVRDDAERASAGLTVGKHIPLTWTNSLGYGLVATAVAALFLLLPTYDLLGRIQARDEQQQQIAQREQDRKDVTKKLDPIRQLARRNSVLKDIPGIEELGKLDGEELNKPIDLKLNAIKKLGKLGDSVREKRDASKFDAMTQMKNMLRQLRDPRLKPSPVSDLQNALAKGDYSKASKALKELQDQLEQAKGTGNKAEIAKQLDSLAGKLNKLAKLDKLNKDLQGAGLTKKQAAELMKKLEKMDENQLKKALAKMGIPSEKLAQLARKMMQNQAACKACKQLGDNLKKMAAGGKAGQGESGEGGAGAAEQLSEMEQLQQEMEEIQAAMNEIRAAMNQLGGGQGGGGNQGGGNGFAQGGKGRAGGGLRPEEEAAFALTKRKAKVKTDRGQIIGQTFIDGVQLKGDATAKYVEAVQAARDESTEALANDRIPRQYHKPLREYFRQMEADLSDPSSATETKQE